MNFNNIFDKAFGNISPVSNDDEILKSVMERTEKMENKKKISVKKPLVIGIVSAAVLAFGITGYASGWNYREVFDRVFGEKAENIEENILEEGTVIENSIEEFDIRLSGAASDKHSSVIILDIASKDGTRLYDPIIGEDIFNEKYNIFLSTYSPDFNYHGLSWSQDYIEYDENSIRISLTTGTNYDMTGEKIYIRITERENPDKKWVTSVDIDTEVKEVFYNDIPEFEMEIMSRKDLEEFIRLQHTGTYEKKYKRAKITELKISPLTLYITGEIPVEMYLDFENSYAVTEDGQKIKFRTYGSNDGAGPGEEYYGGCHIGLEEPVAPERVTAIVFSGIEVEIK